MPLYEYRCRKCGREFEEMQRITEPPIRKCPDCGRRTVERLISATSFVLKGSGWYATDYARKSGAAASGSEKKDDSSKTEKAAAKGEPKASADKEPAKAAAPSP